MYLKKSLSNQKRTSTGNFLSRIEIERGREREGRAGWLVSQQAGIFKVRLV
jgi:hypothetical protein